MICRECGEDGCVMHDRELAAQEAQIKAEAERRHGDLEASREWGDEASRYGG